MEHISDLLRLLLEAGLLAIIAILYIYAAWATRLNKHKEKAIREVITVLSDSHISRLTADHCKSILKEALKDENVPTV